MLYLLKKLHRPEYFRGNLALRRHLRANLEIGDAMRWPSSLLSPSSMGWYSFARAWIWMQANTFGGDGRAFLSCSIARVRFRATELSGFSIGRLAGRVLRRFTTHTGGRIEETLGATVEVRLLDGGTEVFSGLGRQAGLEVVRAQELFRGKEAIPR